MLESDSKTVRFDLSNYQELVIDVPRLRLSNIFKHYPSPSLFPSFPFPSSLSLGTFALNSQNYYNPLFEKILDPPLIFHLYGELYFEPSQNQAFLVPVF